MRVSLLFSPILLAACMQTAPQTGGELRLRQEAACVNAIAAHIRRPTAEVTVRWLSETGGISQIEALDGGRRHLCSVGADGRVISFSHPR